jgi:hypothetical protein
MIAKTLRVQNLAPSASEGFSRMCQDILASETSRVGSKTNQARVKEIVKEIVQKELGAIGRTKSVRTDGPSKTATAGAAKTAVM